MPQQFDVLIIGAGIVGSACAYQLTLAGRKVAVLERDTPGSGATAAGMGHIVVMDESQAQIDLSYYSQRLWDELGQSNPQLHEYRRCGTLWVAADDDEMREVEHKQRVYQQTGIASQIVDAQQLYQLEPNLRAGLAGGLLVGGDSVVYPPRSAAYLIEQARQAGAQYIAGQAERIDGNSVILADGRQLLAKDIVLANGIGTLDLLPNLPIRAKKGHLVITDRYLNYVKHQLIELGYVKNAHASEGDSVAFNVQPRATGQVLIGSSRQFDLFDRNIDQRMLSWMLQQAQQYMPSIGQLSAVRIWTGLRAATPDGLPLIGPHPTLSGIWLATGHEGLGITTSLATAKLLAAQMSEHEAEIPIAPYLPNRFAIA